MPCSSTSSPLTTQRGGSSASMAAFAICLICFMVVSIAEGMDQNNDIAIFDRKRLSINRARATNDASFLRDWSAERLAERLSDVMREFPLALQIGAADRFSHTKIGALFTMDLLPCGDVIADEEFLPLRDSSLDLVVSNLVLHSVNDLPGALVQIRRALKDDGMFISAMLGGETLRELRASLAYAEAQLRDGISPRVFPFADKPQMGDLLGRAGFALPVVDSDILKVSYDNMFDLMRDIRAMGEGNIIAGRDKRYAGREFFMEAARYYQENFAAKGEDGRIEASFEVIFLIGWAPHASQQQPLKPGSAEMRLADALETVERKA